MSRKFYWDSWDKEFKNYYQGLLIVVLLLMIACGFLAYMGNNSSIEWLIRGSLKSISTPLAGYEFPNGILDFETQLFLVDQKFVGGQLTLNPIITYIYFFLAVVGLMICLTMTTYLNRFWYTLSIGLTMVMVISLRFELLGLFGVFDQSVTIGVFVLYAAVSYYFHSINDSVDMKWRFISFLLISFILGLGIFLFSEVTHPFLYLANYGFIPFLIICIVFVFLVSHEVIYGILRITTDSASRLNNSNTKHFVILSLIYLLNVGLVQMKNSGFIDWDIFYINGFVLLLVSSVIGFWGVRSREILYGNILPFYPYTAFLYCGLLICSLSFIGFHFYQGNDVAIEVVEDAIIFGHLGFGSMFFIYVIANFINYLIKNLPVYKIAYKEDNFPYFTSRLAGLIVVAALYFSSNQVAKYQGIAAFYNGIGDIYVQTDRMKEAKAMYHESAIYGVNNHKANYSLACFMDEGSERVGAFKKATMKKPSEYAFVNLGMEHERSNNFFEALFAYQDGLAKYPNSLPLRNNLALLYGKTNVLDSTLYYLTGLSSKGFKKEVVLSNLLSVCAAKGVQVDGLLSDSISNKDGRYDIGANMLATNDFENNASPSHALIEPSNVKLNLIKYAYINNLSVRAYTQPQPGVLDLLDGYLSDEDNLEYRERLRFLKAINMYALGMVGPAFKLMEELLHGNQDAAYYRTLLGLWSLERGATKLAIDYFDATVEQRNILSDYYLIIALMKKGAQEEAAAYYGNLQQRGDSIVSMKILTQALTYDLRNKKNIISQGEVEKSNLDHAHEMEATGKKEAAAMAYESLAYNNPFNEETIASSVRFFNDVMENDSKAYDILLSAIEVNQYSEKLIKMYIDQCFSMNLLNYAEGGLMKLLDVLSKEEFSEYEIKFDERKRQSSIEDQEWGI